jgi:UDP-N-acetylglucosamine 2-epimerase (non-hydrolysing)
MKILVIIGTRPEAIKMAPVIRELRAPQGNGVQDSFAPAADGEIDVKVCSTGQHREMLEQVLSLFQITPDFDLDLMRPNQTPTQVAARVLIELESVLQAEKPDWVLVQGDTTTVMAASIAAHYQRVRVGHVEAGLRTYDRANPFPEEVNRVIADHTSDLHFVPTVHACENLRREGISPATIFVTGNTVVDALNWVAHQPPTPHVRALLKKLHVEDQERPVVLVTSHRRENFGEPIRNICHGLRTFAARNNVHLVYPVHPNPNVSEPVNKLLADQPNITLLPPLDYLSMAHLIKHSRFILTDSGGIQEEAPTLGVPVLILRETTERPEAVEAGAARLVGTAPEQIIVEAERLLHDPSAYAAMAGVANPYGDGFAAQRIAAVLRNGCCDEFNAELAMTNCINGRSHALVGK